MLMYNKTIKDHSIDALIGYTAQKYTWEGSDLSGTDFPDDDISWIDAAATKNGLVRCNNGRWLLSLEGLTIALRIDICCKDNFPS